jgi:hypothetical protein
VLDAIKNHLSKKASAVEVEMDEYQSYASSLVPSFRRLSPRNFAVLKAKLATLMVDLEYGAVEAGSSSSHWVSPGSAHSSSFSRSAIGEMYPPATWAPVPGCQGGQGYTSWNTNVAPPRMFQPLYAATDRSPASDHSTSSYTQSAASAIDDTCMP